MTRVFVAGATGYTGREVVRLACERGLEVYAHVRPDSESLTVWRQRFEAQGARVCTTGWDERKMTETLDEVRPDQLFALLGTTRARGKQSGDSYDSVDYGLTMLLARAARASTANPRFVYLSAAGVGPHARGGYYRARFRAESELRELGIAFTIARPSFITGPDRDDGRLGERVGAALSDAALSVAGVLGARRLRDRYQSTTNTELAAGLLRIAGDPKAIDAVVESEALR